MEVLSAGRAADTVVTSMEYAAQGVAGDLGAGRIVLELAALLAQLGAVQPDMASRPGAQILRAYLRQR